MWVEEKSLQMKEYVAVKCSLQVIERLALLVYIDV